mgnify:CR=1 FL=1
MGYAIGFSFSLLSAIRYFVEYPDLDRAIVYVMMGFIIMGLAWLYNRQLDHSNTLNAIEEHLADKTEK